MWGSRPYSVYENTMETWGPWAALVPPRTRMLPCKVNAPLCLQNLFQNDLRVQSAQVRGPPLLTLPPDVGVP